MNPKNPAGSAGKSRQRISRTGSFVVTKRTRGACAMSVAGGNLSFILLSISGQVVQAGTSGNGHTLAFISKASFQVE
jgi:hypothetical protein